MIHSPATAVIELLQILVSSTCTFSRYGNFAVSRIFLCSSVTHCVKQAKSWHPKFGFRMRRDSNNNMGAGTGQALDCNVQAFTQQNRFSFDFSFIVNRVPAHQTHSKTHTHTNTNGYKHKYKETRRERNIASTEPGDNTPHGAEPYTQRDTDTNMLIQTTLSLQTE